MSTEQIVNRVAPTFGFELEAKRLSELNKAAELMGIAKQMPKTVVDPSGIVAAANTTIGEESYQPESEVAEPLTDEEPDMEADIDNPASLEDVVNQRDVVTDAADIQAAKLKLNLMLSSFQQKVLDQDSYNLGFQEFQNKVIKAFKHLGLDTKQFFGV